VTGAVDTLDPIEAARADIVGSKHLIASVVDDLNQHQQWLENYRVSEKRHARWLQFQELKYQTKLKRRAAVRAAKRFTLGVALIARSLWLFILRWTTALVAWLTPRVHALAFMLARWIAAALAWTWATIVMLARALLKAASLALAWTAAAARDAALGLSKAASMTGNWIGVQLTAFEHALQRSLYRAWLQARILARASVKASTIGFAWIAVQSAALAHTLGRLLYRGWLQARILARASLKAASTASAWTAAQSAVLAHKLSRLLYRAWLEWRLFSRAGLEAASAGSTRAAKRSRIFARAARRSALAGSSSAWEKTGSLAQASLDGLAFVSAKSQRLFDKRVVSATEPTESPQPAINGQCTALVCIEPWRAKLPALRESRVTPDLSWQLPPPPEARPPA
jgi:hypothetical protein